MAGLLQAAALLLVLGTTLVAAQPGVDPAGQCYELPELLDRLELTGFKKLLEVMIASGEDANFQDVMNEARPQTLFAPTDAALSHRGHQFGLENAAADLSTANWTLVWPVMQYHIVQGAGIDFVNYPSTLGTFFYTDLGTSPCLPDIMPVGLTVDALESKQLGGDQNPDLLVNAVHTNTPVLYSISTCQGITKVYVIDDVLLPCCTNLFDLRQSPALAPMFEAKDAKPMARRFFESISTRVYKEVPAGTPPSESWNLPKTMVIPLQDALDLFLNDTVGEKPDGRKATALYASLSAYHLSNTSATKREVLTAGSLPMTTFSVGNRTCQTQYTIESYADKAGIPKLRMKAGNNTVEVTAVFELCGNTTLYVVDKPMLPCDWEEIIPCTEYFDVQEDPRVQALINDTAKDPAKGAFSSVFAGYLTDDDPTAKWQMPNTLIIPDAAQVSKVVTPYLKYDESGDGKPDLYNKYSLGLMQALSRYHMSQDIVNNNQLAAGRPVTITMELAENASASCQQTITITPTAAPAAANGKPAPPALKITAGNSTATVLRSWQLCSNTNVYVVDNILMPCRMQELLPCTEFFEVQRYEELKSVTQSQDPLVKAFMGQFAGAVTQGEGENAKWVLPKTVFFPSEAAIKSALTPWIGNEPLDSYKAQLIFQLVAFYHLSDQPSGAKLLKSSFNSLNLTSWLSGNSSRSCQQSATLTYALDPRTNRPTDQMVVVAGNSTARVTKSFETCGGTNVYLVDSLLMPCNIEEFLPCKEYFNVIKEDVFKPFMETQDRWMKAFREWQTGKFYNSRTKRYNLPGVLFIPSGDAIANSLQPWLKSNIGNKLFTESRKAVWETMTTYSMGVESVDYKAFLQEAAINPDVTFNMTTRLALNISKSPCPQFLQLSVSNETGAPAIKVTAGNSTANVVAHFELCYSRNVWVIDQPLYPCQMGATFKAKLNAAGMLGQKSFGVFVAALVALLMLAVRW